MSATALAALPASSAYRFMSLIASPPTRGPPRNTLSAPYSAFVVAMKETSCAALSRMSSIK
jgi:hypothetical protein